MGLMPMSDERRRHGPKDRRKKNGRSEERPSSGRKRPGRAAASRSRIAIPRCSNMPEPTFVCKTQCIIIPDKTPQKSWKNLSHCRDFRSFCCLFRHLCDAIRAEKVNRGRFITPSYPCNKRFARSSYPPAISQGWRYPMAEIAWFDSLLGGFAPPHICGTANRRPGHGALPAASHHLHLRHASGHPRLQGRGACRLPGAQ